MTKIAIKRALENAEMIRISRSLPLFVLWEGGTSFNVYSTNPNYEETIHEVDVFHVSNDNGMPVSRDEADKLMQDYLQRQKQSKYPIS